MLYIVSHSGKQHTKQKKLTLCKEDAFERQVNILLMGTERSFFAQFDVNTSMAQESFHCSKVTIKH